MRDVDMAVGITALVIGALGSGAHIGTVWDIDFITVGLFLSSSAAVPGMVNKEQHNFMLIDDTIVEGY